MKIPEYFKNIASLDPTAGTSGLESETDRMVYELCGHTEEEIKIVEGRCKNKC